MAGIRARRLAGLLLFAAACARTEFADRIPMQADGDELVPEVTEPALCGIPISAVTWSAPVQLTDVDDLFAPIVTNPTFSYYDPTLRDDGLTLYLASDAASAWRTFELVRTSIAAPFSTLRQLPDDVTPPNIGVFGYQRVDAVNLAIAGGAYPVEGNPNQTMVYVLSDPRQDPAQWSLPDNEDVSSKPLDARLTATGRTIVYASPGADGNRKLYTQSRASLTAPFLAPVRVEGLPVTDISAPWLSTDERVLLFVRDDEHTSDTNDIWIATRDKPGEAFTNFTAVSINAERFDGEPYVLTTSTACELYFISVRSEGVPRLFRSVIEATPAP